MKMSMGLLPYLLLLGGMLPAAREAAAQAVPVTFQVRMSYQIEQGAFQPQEDFVDLAGTFNGWGSDPLTILSDADGDSIYAITLEGFTPGQAIEFKFRMNGLWDGSEEFPGGGPNRRYTVVDGENQILVWYNDEVPYTGPPLAGFQGHPRALRANGLVAFQDLSAGEIDFRQWTFEGGDPESSNDRNPVVFYTEPGHYDVTLVVGNSSQSDTLAAADYIQVQDLGLDELSWWNDNVFYEIFVRSFHDSDGDGIGDFQGLIQKLDYLNDGDPQTDSDLGITGIWLMPINDSPSYHGYDVVDYRSINPDYGTMEDFQEFLQAAQDRGIRVIIDYVMNHCSSQHPWFEAAAQNEPDFRDYYRWSESDPGQNGPWGQDVWHWHSTGWYYGLFWGGMPDLNYETQAVKDSMFASAAWWLDEVGVDGFRLDAVLYILEDGEQLQNTEETYQFWHDYNAYIKAVKPDALSVGEAWINSETVLNYVVDDRLDFCFEFDLAGSILGAVNSEDAQGLAFKANQVYGLYPYLQYAPFLSNHDQNRVFDVLGQDETKAKLAAGIYLTMPGIPFLYYGEEIAMVGSGPHEVIRRPMQWTDGPNAGFTTGIPWTEINSNYQQYNVLVEEQDSTSVLSWYKRLIALRNQVPALRRGEYLPLGSSASPVLAFLRRHEDQTLLVVANAGSGPVEALTLTAFGPSLEPGHYILADLLHDGDTLEIAVSEGQEITGLSAAARQVLVYEFVSGTGADPGDGGDSGLRLHLEQNQPNPFRPSTTIKYYLPEDSMVSLRVYDVAGREQDVLQDGFQKAGPYELSWEGLDENGEGLSAGVYFLRLDVDDETRTAKMMLLK